MFALRTPEAHAFAGGAGTQVSPFEITTAAELASLNDYLGSSHASKYFKLMNDIDLDVSPYNTGNGWTPIGTDTLSTGFYGKFDGNYKTISNLYTTGTNVRGLFGTVASNAIIENVLLKDVDVTATTFGAGALVASNYGTINRAGVTGGSVTGGQRVGGLVGSNRGPITESFADVSVFFNPSGTTCCAGGLASEAFGASSYIRNSYSRGDVTVTFSASNQGAVGGLYGNDNSSNGDYNLYSTGAVAMVSGNFPPSTGGLAGTSGASVTASYWDTQTSGQATSGGAGAVGRTTAQMKTQSTYSGWDFDTIWAIDPAINDGYPYLQWLSETSELTTAYSLAGSATLAGEAGSTLSITDLQITTSGDTSATVPVKLLVSSGTLSMTTTTGLTFTGSSSGSTLYFSGTIDDVNDALATLRYTRSSGTGSDTLEVSLVGSGEVFFPGNGHLYEYVNSTLTWGAAKTAAEGRTKYGATGYLATITSSAENDFVAARLANAGWMGASDAGTEGDWKWVTGPESGTSFWSGLSNGSAVSGRYENWNNGEPNDSSSNEDCAQYLATSGGLWNDLPCSGTTLPGYVVEYGADGDEPTVTAKNITLTISDTTAPSTPTPIVAESVTNDNTPQLMWPTSTDSFSGMANPAYSVQWASDSGFTSDVQTVTTNSTTFSPSSAIADGTWYFRVRSRDSANNHSAYSATRTIIIDTTAPNAPGAPSLADSPTKDTTPTLTWAPATDAGAGLDALPYNLQWSQSSTFSTTISSMAVGTHTYTVPSPLAEGTWYARVSASDQLGHNSSYSPIGSFIIDLTAPELILTGGDSLTLTQNDTFTDPGATALDSIDGTLTSSIVVTGSVNTARAGTYKLTYAVTDAAGNKTSTIRTVVVKALPTVAASTKQTSTSRSSSTASTTTEEPITQPAPAEPANDKLILNNFPVYYTDQGKAVNMSTDDKVYFHLERNGETEEHSITVKQVGNDGLVTLTIASTPFDVAMRIGESRNVDVDKDGVDDVYIRLLGVSDGHAQMVVRQLTHKTAAAPGKEATQQSSWWWIVVVVLLGAATWYVAGKNRRRQNQA